jgi:hypothetical protein
MKTMTRLFLALAVLTVGLLAGVTTGSNHKICFYSVSCGDRILPCVCLPDASTTCRLCTGTAIGNFCFDCPDSRCLATAEVYCGYEYKGICVALCEPCPRQCAAVTLVGACGAAACR